MKKTEFTALWKGYEPLIKGIVELFHPFVEAAVHDLETGKVVAIFHNISQRKIGEASPLNELIIRVEDFPDYFSPYYKQNWDGRPLKCISITIRNKRGKPVGLICINIDVSYFQEGYRLLEVFLGIKQEAENPIEMFGAPLESQVEEMFQQYLEEHRLQLSLLNRNQKKELVQYLYRKGIFNFKNAAQFIANKLKTSRATVYNHIKSLK
jgi:predicted transcriptional regulator YheO